MSLTGAKSWTLATLPPAAWTAVSVSAGGFHSVVVARGGQVYHSLDGGSSWGSVDALRALNLPWTDVEYAPSNWSVAVASWANATSGGAFRTTDGGANWVPLGCKPLPYATVATDDSGSVIVLGPGVEQGDFLLMSRDGGASFAVATYFFPGVWTDLTVSSDAKLFYAVRKSDSDITSVDGGLTWQAGGASTFATTMVATANGYTLRLAAEPFAVGNSGGRIFASVNWTEWRVISQPKFWRGLALSPSGNSAVAVAFGDTSFATVSSPLNKSQSQSWTPRA